MMKLTTNTSSSSFTLIELLVVIAIIALLAALMYPAVISARERAKRRQAMTEACNIAVALKMYKLEHGKWPNQKQGTNDTTYFTNNYLVINPLTIPGSNAAMRIYLSFQANTNTLDIAGNYLDPWGVPYAIAMDEDDNKTLVINFTNQFYTNSQTGVASNYAYSAKRKSRSGAAAASLGSRGDVICSWEEVD